jgi:hypothetical protein
MFPLNVTLIIRQLYIIALGEIMAPRISLATRISETSAVVTFTVPPSEQDAEYFEILLYTADNGKRFNEVQN